MSSQWKTSQTCLAFNDGDREGVSCYRLFSLLCRVSKVIGKLIFNVIHTLTKDKLHDNHFGFRKKRSATLQRLVFPDKLYVLKDKSALRNLAFLYLNFSKAFDAVQHTNLPEKIRSFGIKGNCWKWFKAICQKKQFIRQRNSKSMLKKIIGGGPFVQSLDFFPFSSTWTTFNYLWWLLWVCWWLNAFPSIRNN